MNTVTVLYHPVDFPNDITDSATASVAVIPPPPVGACHETVRTRRVSRVPTPATASPMTPSADTPCRVGRVRRRGRTGTGRSSWDRVVPSQWQLFSDTTPIAFPGGDDVKPENTR